jgi:hypothetical protein
LFGYDTGLGGGVIAQPAFIKDMGITETGKPLANIKANIVSILQGGVSYFRVLFNLVEFVSKPTDHSTSSL